MPQELKPCPACNGGESELLTYVMDDHSARIQVMCICGCSGGYKKTEAEAVTAWNALPRALVWTTEPPAFGEWNWWRLGLNDENRPYCRYVYTDGTIDNTMIGRINWQDIGGQWAGPIPAPQEPAL